MGYTNLQEVSLNTHFTILKKILPQAFFEQKNGQGQKMILDAIVPLITHSEYDFNSRSLTFYALSKDQCNAFRFFFEMISRWLLPSKKLELLSVYANQLVFGGDTDAYMLCEMVVRIETPDDFVELQRNFPMLQGEIALGLQSPFYGQRILEAKGLSLDQKAALIQGLIAFLVKRFPQIYHVDIFSEMQYMLVMCGDEFKSMRQPRHLARLIALQYLFRRGLSESMKKNAQRRYLTVNVCRPNIVTLKGHKRVLGIMVGFNLLRDNEMFEEKHLLKAIQHFVPSAIPIEGSLMSHKWPNEKMSILYLEIEKENGEDFSGPEIKKLRQELSPDLKNRIEHRLNPVFMPRNEEEVMRNILILSNQLKYVRDIPQVFITFDEQAQFQLLFTIILVRILKSDSRPVCELFEESNTFFNYVQDRTKVMGYLRKKYPKEATVFRLKLPKENFLRADHSIDLYKARQTVVAEVSRIMGEIRDYNGGMISKQNEQLTHIRYLLSESGIEYNELLLENFFYSISPVVMRSLVDPQAFATLFLMLMQGLKEYKQEGYYLKIYPEEERVFALIIVEDPEIKDIIQEAVQELNIPQIEMANAFVRANGQPCIGYICSAHDPEKLDHFSGIVLDTLQAWDSKAKRL